ncbi:MAG: radical SAM protein [Candidatus Paceibacterota bacterium]|jgi:uncharacterized protein
MDNSLRKKQFDPVSMVSFSSKKYAIIEPNKIIFVVDSSEKQVEDLVKKEKAAFKKQFQSNSFLEKRRQNLVALTLLPTRDCNLRCIYCYAKGGEYFTYMPLQVAFSSLDALAKNADGKDIILKFAGGGEPFMNFELMQKAYKYAKDLFNKVYPAVVTNGTFNSEQLDWILENDVSLRLSFDGIAHEKQRPFKDNTSSLEIVEENIKRLISANKSFMIECIVTNESVRKMAETVAYVSQLGISVLKIEPVHISEISRGDSSMIPTPQEFVNNFLVMLEYIVDHNLKIKIDTGFFSKPSINAYCYVNGRNLIITPEGNITSCVEVTKKTDPFAEMMIYGSVLVKKGIFSFNKIALSKLKTLHFNNCRKCTDCRLRLICGGGCSMRNLWDNGFPLKPSKYICQIEHLLIPEIFSLVVDDSSYSDILFDDVEINC